MRFLLRSAFWLCLAYMVIKPGADLAQMGADVSTTALAAGRDVVAAGVEQITCDTLQCLGGKAVLGGALAATAPTAPVVTPPAPQHANAVPLPRPRPSLH